MTVQVVRELLNIIWFVNLAVIFVFFVLAVFGKKYKLSNSKYALINLLFFQLCIFIMSDFRLFLSSEVFKINPLRWSNLVYMNFSIFLLADLTFYFIHRLQHKVNFLWKLHRIHHQIDVMEPDVHYRHSPFLIPFQILLSLFVCLLFNLNLIYFSFYLSLISLYQLLLHTNKLKFYEQLGLVLILPQYHRTHHVKGAEHLNFGGILSVWDRIFGTFSSTEISNRVYGTDLKKY